VSLATVDVTAAEPEVVLDPLRETDPRGRYTAGVRLPVTVRELHLRVVINRTLTLEEAVEVPAVVFAAPAPAVRVAPPTVQVQVIRAAQPFHHPEDDEVPTDEEK
jgi:hypothetical protein